MKWRKTTTHNLVRETGVDHSDKSLFGVRVVGGAMEPMAGEGDIAVVSKTAEPRSGDLVLVAVKGTEYQIRKVKIEGDTVVLTALDPKYSPEICERQKIRSILRVVGLYKDLR